ncbi:MAG: lipopolysaccharide transport periplasmic protein LptA [Candidatus Binatia bacterium]|nr:lipopolysaccharide transport periplasmic protein LptA [Candidatus Binatia bacterium]
MRREPCRSRGVLVVLAIALVLFSPRLAEAQDAPSAAPTSEPAAEDLAAGVFGGLSFSSEDDPIVVEADKLEFDYEKNRLVYRGAVHVVQGDLELTSDNLILTFDRADELEKAQMRRVVAQGNVVITQGERQASGRRAVFDQMSRQIVLLGDPVLRDGPNEVQGDRLTVYLDEGRSVVESSPKRRVSAILFPGGVEAEAGESATDDASKATDDASKAPGVEPDGAAAP